ncbi:MAG TPA: CorA family divalent cation transporter [Gaiellaceae bacterium]|nr:CorA family divalent cation transporter [Gaiellaceae bacterium]
MAARWLDLVDPTSEEVLAVLPVHVDPEVVETLAARPAKGREPRPVIEGHGAYVFGVLMAARPVPEEDRISYQEIDFIASPGLLVTVRKTPTDGTLYDPAGLHPAAAQDTPAGELVFRMVDDIADSYLGFLDAAYAEIEELEDEIDTWPASRVRSRISDLRHELLHGRRTVAATRAAVRRITDGRIEVGDHALFPPTVERLFADTYDTLVRVAEELDIARELLAGVRDHHQSMVVEGQGEVGKKLTVIASLVLVPSLIVGYYGQNFESAFDEAYWSLGVSTGLILASSLVQLALFRWRRWI